MAHRLGPLAGDSVQQDRQWVRRLQQEVLNQPNQFNGTAKKLGED